MNKTITNIVISVLLFSITVVFDSCSTKREIKVITEPDSTYVNDNYDLAVLKTENKLNKKPYKVEKFLYFASGKGNKPYNYELYINKEGYTDKVRIIQSLSDKQDKEFINLISERYFGHAVVNKKPAKYRENLTNKMFNWTKYRDKIKFTDKDDPAYVSNKQVVFSPRNVADFNFIHFTNVGSQILFRYYEDKIADEVGNGHHVFIYKYFINEEGSIDKIKIIRGIGGGLDEKVVPETVALKYKYYLEPDTKLKSFILMQFFVNISDNEITDISYNYFHHNINGKKYSERISKPLELIQEKDSSYTDLEYLDLPFYLDSRRSFKLVSSISQFQVDRSKFKKYKQGFNYYLYIDQSGLVEKAQVVESLSKELDALFLDKIKYIVFNKGYVRNKPAKFCIRAQILLGDNATGDTEGASMIVLDDRQQRYDAGYTREYEKKTFEVLPDVLPAPIGGVEAISEKIKYPDIAKYHKIDGDVIIKCYIDTNGTPLGVQVLKSVGFNLEKAAIDAIMETRFTPAIQGGRKVKSILVLPFEYKLNHAGVRITRDDLAAPPPPPIANVKINDDEFEITFDENPFPIGGMNALQKNISYPEVAKLNKVQGKVLVKAYIDEEGNVLNTELIKGIGSGCDEAAMEAIKRTKFHPAKIQGEPVKVQISIPIVFNLK